VPIDLSPYHAVLLDLDGTLCEHNTPLPGAVEFLACLKTQNTRYACLTNSGGSPIKVCLRLEAMGIDIDPDHIYTAAGAACDLVMEMFSRPRVGDRKPRVFNLATESCHDMLDGLVEWVERGDQPCDAILVGGPVNRHASPDRQSIALRLAKNGATLIGTCADRAYPGPAGLEFGAGALTWKLAYAAGVQPVFCGKPQEVFFHELCNRLNVQPDWCLLIGDNLEADIFGAKAVGMRTILTLTGVASPADVDALPDEHKPDLVVKDLTELL
jgi:HAD superfamily hydrolase (TIGR01450 family)